MTTPYTIGGYKMTMMDASGNGPKMKGSMFWSIDVSNPVIGAPAGAIFNSNLRAP